MFNMGRMDDVMRRILISVDALVAVEAPHASLQVALHVTKRHNGANASNRVRVGGGISGREDSQEALSNAAADGVSVCWSKGNDASSAPGYGV